jgi:NADH-quinone oxidoreductase subunit L
MVTHAFFTVPFWLVVAGIGLAYYLYIVRPDLPGVIREKAGILTRILENKYGFDDFNQRVLADGTVKIGAGLWKVGDVALIDGLMVNGSARLVGLVARIVRLAQTGFIYTYAFVMIFGLFTLLSLWLYWIWVRS